MINAQDWFDFIFRIPGGPRVVMQEPDFDKKDQLGILKIYCHQKMLKHFRNLDQEALKPVAFIWVFKARSHAWLKRNSAGSRAVIWNGKVELK